MKSHGILERKAAKKAYNKAWNENVRMNEKLRLALKSKKEWNYIRRRINEDCDVVGAEEFRTPDGIIYYAAGMLYVIKAIGDHKEFMKNRDKAIRRRKYSEMSTNKEWMDKRRKRVRVYQKERRASCAQHRIADALRVRLCNVMRGCGGKKLESTEVLLGCSLDHLKSHLESRFKPGMTWENFGRKKGMQCWEIDHILPCASFDLTDPEQQRKCFHYTNLQPLWGIENRMKSSSIIPVNS